MAEAPEGWWERASAWLHAFELPSSPETFGDYASFLELAFAFNAFYGIWSYISSGDPRPRKPRARMAVIVHAFPTAEKAHTRAFDSIVSRTQKIVRWGRCFGFVVAGMIAVSLSLVKPSNVMWTPFVWLCWAPAALLVLVELHFRARRRWIEWSITHRYSGALEELMARGGEIPGGPPTKRSVTSGSGS